MRRNLAGGDSFSGCWATAGVVLDKGAPRVSAQGKEYSIWKMGALDDADVSVFLFGDAHAHHSGAAVGAVFALFNGNVRMDNGVPDFSILHFSSGLICAHQSDADLGVLAGERVLGERRLRRADDEDGSLRGFRDLQGEEERWDGLHHGHKQVCISSATMRTLFQNLTCWVVSA